MLTRVCDFARCSSLRPASRAFARSTYYAKNNPCTSTRVIQRCEKSTVAVSLGDTPATVASSSSSSSSPEPGPEPEFDTTPVKTGAQINAFPFLPRPLGVTEPPTTARTTWRDETLALMNQDHRLARRKHIIKEAAKGYYSDLNATRKHGGKTWIAPQTLIREDHALYFPDIAGKSLATNEEVHTTDICKGKISVIAMLSTAISEEHVHSFVSLINRDNLSNPNYRYVQVNLQENIAKAFLVSLYASSLRRSIPQELHSTYLLSKQNMEFVREPLGMNNKHIGFAYLLDQQLRVRWAGGGMAVPGEAESLRACVKVLLRRMME